MSNSGMNDVLDIRTSEGEVGKPNHFTPWKKRIDTYLRNELQLPAVLMHQANTEMRHILMTNSAPSPQTAEAFKSRDSVLIRTDNCTDSIEAHEGFKRTVRMHPTDIPLEVFDVEIPTTQSPETEVAQDHSIVDFLEFATSAQSSGDTSLFTPEISSRVREGLVPLLQGKPIGTCILDNVLSDLSMEYRLLLLTLLGEQLGPGGKIYILNSANQGCSGGEGFAGAESLSEFSKAMASDEKFFHVQVDLHGLHLPSKLVNGNHSGKRNLSLDVTKIREDLKSGAKLSSVKDVPIGKVQASKLLIPLANGTAFRSDGSIIVASLTKAARKSSQKKKTQKKKKK